MAVNAGNSDCTSGLAKRIYDFWVADSRSGLVSPLTGDAQGSVRAMCYAIARAVAAEIAANAEVTTTVGGSTPTGEGVR
jgi:hypothetical protein